MASFINKAKDKIEAVLQKDNNQADNPQSSNAGPHSSNLVNKGDPRIDSDRDHRNDPTSRVGGYGDTQTTSGYGGGIGQSDTYGSTGSHPGYDDSRSTNAGPHSSNLLNKADPRVDSDRDGRNDPSSRVGGYGNTQQLGDSYGTSGGPGGLGTTETVHSQTTIDDGYSTGEHVGHTGHHHHTGHTGHTGGLAAATTTGYSGAGGETHTGTHTGTSGYGTSGYDDPRSSNTGPHSSNLLNKADPRIDSDRDNRNDPTSRVGGYGTQDNYGSTGGYGEPTGTTGGYGTTTSGYGESAGTTGGYGTSTGRVGNTGYDDNSYNSGSGRTGYDDNSYTPGSGKATKTAGPHDSNLLNQLDPRVDSDMDGSKTYGGNQTHR